MLCSLTAGRLIEFLPISGNCVCETLDKRCIPSRIRSVNGMVTPATLGSVVSPRSGFDVEELTGREARVMYPAPQSVRRISEGLSEAVATVYSIRHSELASWRAGARAGYGQTAMRHTQQGAAARWGTSRQACTRLAVENTTTANGCERISPNERQTPTKGQIMSEVAQGAFGPGYVFNPAVFGSSQDHVWATEEEKQEQFYAEMFPVDERSEKHPSLRQLRTRALERSDFPPGEIYVMTRAELIRVIDGQDPRD